MEYLGVMICTHDIATIDILKCEISTQSFYMVSNRVEYKECVDQNVLDLIFIDLAFLKNVSESKEPFVEEIHSLIKKNPDAVIILLCESKMSRSAIHSLRAGAEGYLSYPTSAVEVRHILDAIEEEKLRNLELQLLREESLEVDSGSLMTSSNAQMISVLKSTLSVAATDSTVLLMGETGVGKNVIAETIHINSSRSNKPFINVHCGAIPENLIESDLFGHERGAFTGAANKKIGKFELAEGGTIFLDEIGTMTPVAQIKLLKVLQEKIFQRVGSEKNIKSNVRVIAAANRDLQELCEAGEFRYDLYYRLNVFPIMIPPLRERLEDLEPLSILFLKQMNQKIGKDIMGIHPDVILAFKKYDWPGNIRELQNFIERACIIEESHQLMPISFPVEVVKSAIDTIPDPLISLQGTLYEARQMAADYAEETYIKEKLFSNNGKISRTAEEAGISVRYLNKLMTKYGLKRKDFKN